MKSRKHLVWAFSFFAVVAVLGSSFSAFSRVSAPVRNFEFTYVTRIPALPADAKPSRIWIPLPQSNVSQAISGLKIESPFAFATRRDSEYGNSYVYLEIPAAKAAAPTEVRVIFQVARQEHLVVLAGNSSVTNAEQVNGAQAAANAGELKRFLEPDRRGPVPGGLCCLFPGANKGNQ